MIRTTTMNPQRGSPQHLRPVLTEAPDDAPEAGDPGDLAAVAIPMMPVLSAPAAVDPPLPGPASGHDDEFRNQLPTLLVRVVA
jgi:hypothetical protein